MIDQDDIDRARELLDIVKEVAEQMQIIGRIDQEAVDRANEYLATLKEIAEVKARTPA